MSEKLFNQISFDYRVSLKMNELNNVSCIKDLLYLKLEELNNKCCEKGYIKENSIKILEYSSGYLNPIIFCPFIEYRLKCVASIFLPEVDDIYLVKIVSINKIGIMCKIYYDNYNKTYSPINIIIAKHTQNNDISNLKINDLIYIKILALKFNKNSENIHTIGNIINDSEIKDIKNISLIINELNNIDLQFSIQNLDLIKYTNILKFILDKEVINRKELFIYNFIKTNNIKLGSDYKELYNKYIENYNLNINKTESCNDSNELETDINIYDNLESETIETELYEKTSNIDDYDLDSENSNHDSYLNVEESDEESSSNESDNDENEDDINLENSDDKDLGLESIETDLTENESEKKK